MRRLIVNGDDFGLTAGVNRALLELHRAGALRSVTLMARAAATEEALQLACATPSLGVGCHLVLVDGTPVLPAREIPSLTDPRTGRFLPTPGAFLARLLTGWVGSEEIEAEAAAQMASLHSRGVDLTHIDTHKHLHIFPAVLRAVLRAARTAGVRAIRNPFESAWSRVASSGTSWLRWSQFAALRVLEPAFLRTVAEAGLVTTGGAVGILAAGSLDATMLRKLLAAMPDGTWELVTHPGYCDRDLEQAHTRLLASRERELLALMEIGQVVGVETISFADLPLWP